MGLGQGEQVGERPPKALLDKFKANNVPDEIGLIEEQIEEMNHQIRCLDDIDPEVIRKYQSLIEDIETISREKEEMENKVHNSRKDLINPAYMYTNINSHFLCR